MSKIYDITFELSEKFPPWPGDKSIEITQDLSMSRGDVCNLSHFTAGMHIGTHIDVPLHFIKDGKDTADIELEKFMGKAKVFEIDEPVEIGVKHLEKLDIDENDIVLLKVVRNEELLEKSEFCTDFVYINVDAARFLTEKKIKAIGINYHSIEKYNSPDFAVHKMLLGHETVIYETLNLKGVKPGEYQIFCLPLKIKGGNGSPVRAILIK